MQGGQGHWWKVQNAQQLERAKVEHLKKSIPMAPAVSTEGGWWGMERELGKHATEMGTCQVRVSRWACTTANFQR